MPKKLNTFYIGARISIETTLKIEAESLEDALEKSKDLETGDFITFKGEFDDGGIDEIYSVYKASR